MAFNVVLPQFLFLIFCSHTGKKVRLTYIFDLQNFKCTEFLMFILLNKRLNETLIYEAIYQAKIVLEVK